MLVNHKFQFFFLDFPDFVLETIFILILILEIIFIYLFIVLFLIISLFFEMASASLHFQCRNML